MGGFSMTFLLRVFFVFFFIGNFSIKIWAYSIKSDLKDIRISELEIGKIKKEFNQKKLGLLLVKFLKISQTRAVESIKIINSELVVDLTPPFGGKEETYFFPIEALKVYNDDYSLDLKKDVKLYFSNLKELTSFKSFLDKILKLREFQSSCCKKIFSGKTKEKLLPKDKKMIMALDLSFFKKEAQFILSEYLDKYNVYEKTAQKFFIYEKSFDDLISLFFTYVEMNPNLILDLNIETLVSFFEQIKSSCSQDKTRDLYQNFFIKYPRELLILLRDENLKNGEKIRSFYKGEAFTEQDFFTLLAKQSDIISLCDSRNGVKKERIDEILAFTKKEDLSKVDLEDGLLYNFEELVRVSKVHILLLLDLYKKLTGSSWEKKLNPYLRDSLSQKELAKNVRLKRDIDPLYGRWHQGGKVLKGHIEVAHYSKANKMKAFGRIHSEVLAKKLFRSDKTYKQIMTKLSLQKASSMGDSSLEVLSFITATPFMWTPH